jgi:predicted transcriptional regulator
MCNGIQWCECFNIGDKKLDKQEGIERLFYELASESRLDILLQLKEKNWKMNDVARKLNLTTTETFRQLQRLSEALLVQKQPEGTYAITEYGRLVLELSSPIEFVLKHKEYFLTHDVWRLPHQFVKRLGELSQTSLRMGMIESTTKSSQMIGEAEQYMWGAIPEPPPGSFDTIVKQIPKKVEFKILSPLPPAKFPNLENRTLPDLPAIFGLTEKEAVICFRFIGGRQDHAGFFGKDTVFLNWVRDLFLYYWDKGKCI